MTKMSEPIVFFGSGPVAAESLRLLAQHASIEAVITKPRPAHHKGGVPVIALAEELQIPLYMVTNKRTLNELFAAKPVQSKLAVLIDFGIIVSQDVIDYFPRGILNSHFSLLPQWRGADPITFSILSGQKRTGVSLMLLTAGMDEGPLLAQTEYILTSNTTIVSLTAGLITVSDAQLQAVLPLYLDGQACAVDQQEASMVTKAHVIDITGSPGSRDVLHKLPVVYCGEGALALDMIKPAGKKEMTGEAFLAGYKTLFLAA